jgi:hypothetical protein
MPVVGKPERRNFDDSFHEENQHEHVVPEVQEFLVIWWSVIVVHAQDN